MKYGIIDIGTHTTRLAVFDTGRRAGRVPDVERDIITRLGEGLRASGVLSREAMDRTLETLKNYKTECERLGVDRVVAAGTAALRAARNASDFIKSAAGIGVDVEVIGGELEGALSFLGVVSGLDPRPEALLVIDVGGGSTEFTIGRRGGPPRTESLPVGAVVLNEKYLLDDPPAAAQRIDLEKEVRDLVIERISRAMIPGAECVGVAGTVSTLAMMDAGLEAFDSRAVHGHRMRVESVRGMVDRLMAMDLEQRRAVPGMEPLRADVIHAGAAIVAVAMEALGVDSMLVSQCDIRHGLLRRELERADGSNIV